MKTQHTWAQALLDPASAAPNGLVTWNQSDPPGASLSTATT